MRTLFIITSGYPNCDDIFKRIIKSKKATTEGNPTFIRRGDGLSRGAFEFVGAPFKVSESQYDNTGDAFLEEIMQTVDYVIVYGAPESQPVPFLKQKSKFPYDRIYPTIEFNLAPKKPVKRAKKKGAEYSEEGD